MTYTPTNWTNISTVTDVLRVANDNASGYFWTGIVYMIFIIVLISSLAFGWESAILIAGFVGVVLSIIAMYMGLVSITVLGSFVGVLILTFIYLIWSSRYD